MAKQAQKLFRVGAAAHELGLHPMTVRRWIKAGRIHVVQVGREMRIPRSEIERMVGGSDERLLVLYGRVSGHWRPKWTVCKRGRKPSGEGKRPSCSLILALASKPHAGTSSAYSS